MKLCFIPRSHKGDEGSSMKGISLVEIILVVATIGFVVILMANLPNALGLITKSRHISLAKEIATKQIEDKRSISYVNLVNDKIAVSDPRLNLLPAGAGVIEVKDCDPIICTNSEPIKHVKVTVSWNDNQKDQDIMLETFIGEGGLNQ